MILLVFLLVLQVLFGIIELESRKNKIIKIISFRKKLKNNMNRIETKYSKRIEVDYKNKDIYLT